MIDGLGNTININDWVTWSSAGNRDAKYGMMIGQIVSSKERAKSKLRNPLPQPDDSAINLSIKTVKYDYVDSEFYSTLITKQSNKVAKVDAPSGKLKFWLEFYETLAEPEIKNFKEWLHHGTFL